MPLISSRSTRSLRKAGKLLAEAVRWAAFVADLRQTPANGPRGKTPFCPHEKALAAAMFSLRAGFASLAVPSKLVGVREHQHTIRQMKANGARFGTRLRFLPVGGRIGVATTDDALLGFVQAKHEAWLRPLLETEDDEDTPAVRVHLLTITGNGTDGTLHGVNVCFCGL